MSLSAYYNLHNDAPTSYHLSRSFQCQPELLRVQFKSYRKWTKKHKNVTNATNNSVFRSSGEKNSKAWLRYKRPNWKRVKTPTSWAKFIRLEKQARKTRNFVFRYDVNINERETPDQSELRHQAQRRRSQPRSKGKTGRGRVLRKPATSSSKTTWACSRTDYFFASEDVKVWVKKNTNTTKIGEILRHNLLSEWI